MLQHLARPADPLRLQLIKGHNPIHQAHGQSLVGPVLTAEKPNLPCLALAHHPRQIAGAKAPIKTAHPRSRLAKYGVLSSQAQVTQQVQHLATTDRVTRHQGNHHLRQAADQALQIQHIEPGQTRLVEIAPIAAHALIAASAKGPATISRWAGAGKQHHPDPRVVADSRKGVAKLLHGAGPEGVALVGSIDRDAGDPLLA